MFAKYVDLEEWRRRKSQLTKSFLRKNIVDGPRPELEVHPNSGKDKTTRNHESKVLVVKPMIHYRNKRGGKRVKDENGPEVECDPVGSREEWSTNTGLELLLVRG